MEVSHFLPGTLNFLNGYTDIEFSYSITHGPTSAERQLMDDWIRDLRAFVNDEKDHAYGTTKSTEYKVMRPEGTVAIENDPRWEELLHVMGIFSG